MNVEQALTIADTLDASEPNQHRALGSLAAEVRRLREREAKARELAKASIYAAEATENHFLQNQWSRWLETE